MTVRGIQEWLGQVPLGLHWCIPDFRFMRWLFFLIQQNMHRQWLCTMAKNQTTKQRMSLSCEEYFINTAYGTLEKHCAVAVVQWWRRTWNWPAAIPEVYTTPDSSATKMLHNKPLHLNMLLLDTQMKEQLVSTNLSSAFLLFVAGSRNAGVWAKCFPMIWAW